MHEEFFFFPGIIELDLKILGRGWGGCGESKVRVLESYYNEATVICHVWIEWNRGLVEKV